MVVITSLNGHYPQRLSVSNSMIYYTNIVLSPKSSTANSNNYN